MPKKFREMVLTDSVCQAQAHYYGTTMRPVDAPPADLLTEEEMAFIRLRDSFYMASVSQTGWPYLQHRGGPPGFLRVLSPTRLAFADYKGNRQMLSTGNLMADDRVALFLMDYPRQERLKILGHARVEDARQQPQLLAELAEPEMRAGAERLFTIEVVSFDWNCPNYITPRYTEAEVEAALAPLRTRIAELEAELKAKG